MSAQQVVRNEGRISCAACGQLDPGLAYVISSVIAELGSVATELYDEPRDDPLFTILKTTGQQRRSIRYLEAASHAFYLCDDCIQSIRDDEVLWVRSEEAHEEVVSRRFRFVRRLLLVVFPVYVVLALWFSYWFLALESHDYEYLLGLGVLLSVVIGILRDCPELSWGLKGRRFSSSVL